MPKSQLSFNLYLSSIDVGLVVIDNENMIRLVNKTFADLIGSDEATLQHQHYHTMLPQDEEPRAMLQDLVEGRQDQLETTRIWWKNPDSFIYVRGYAKDEVSDQYGPCRIAFLRDVSEEVLNRKRLDYQASVLQNVSDSVIVTDREGKITYINQVATALFGLSHRELLHQSVHKLNPDIDVRAFLQEAVQQPDYKRTWEWNFQTADGQQIWVSVKLSPYFRGSEVSGVIVLLVDISEKKEYEHDLFRQREELASLVNSQTNYLIRTDLEGKYTFANPAFLKKFAHYGDVIGKLYFPTIHPDDVAKAQKMVEDCLSNPGNMVSLEMRKPKADGDYYTNYWEFIAITDKQGNPTEIQGVGYDISERKKNELRIINLNELNHLLLNISTNFINVSHHELDEMIPEALRSVTEFTGFERAFVYLFNADKSLGQLSYSYSAPGVKPYQQEEQFFPAEPFSWWMDQILSGKIIQILKVEDLPETARNEKQALQSNGIKSAVAVPIFYLDNFLGYLGFTSLSGYCQWNGESIGLLKLLGAIFANSIYRVSQEKALEESNRQYRMLADNITDMVSRHNTQLRTLFVSPSCYEMLGYQIRDLLGRDMKELLHPDDLEYVQRALEQSKKNGKGSFQARMQQHIGSYKWVESYVTTLQAADSLELILVTRNIDEQKQIEFEKDNLLQETQELNDRLAINERYFKGLIEKSLDAIAIYDEQGFIIYASPSALQITGYPEIVGMHGNDLVIEEDLPEAKQVIEQLKVMPGEHITFEHRIRRKDGKVIWIESVMTNQLQDGAINGLISNFRDITDRKEAALALEENRTSLNIAQRISKVGSWEVDLASGKFTWSEEFYHIFALDPGESGPENTDIYQMVHPEDQQAVRQRNDKVLKELKEMPFSYRIIDARGRLKYLDAQNKVIRDAGGQAVKMLGTVQDVTREIKLEQLLDETSRLAKLGGWEFDVDHNRLTWTSEVYRIHEVPMGEVIPIERAFGFYHPDDVSSVREAFKQIIDEGKNREMEVRVITARGNLKWIRVNGEPHDIKDGKVSRVKGALQDITERKKREEKLKDYSMRLQLATTSAQIGVWDLDVDSGKLIWDQRTCEQHGLSLEEFDDSFESWRNRVHPDDIEEVQQKFNTALENRGDYEAEFRIVRADNGEIRYIQVHATVIEKEATGHLSMIGVSWDITDQKENELNLLKRNEELEKVNSELDHFVYSTSHNLRAPLTSIMGIVQILSDAETEEVRQQYIGLIDKSIHKLDETIQEISDYSRNSRIALQVTSIDLRQLILEVKESLSFMENASLLQYQIEVPEQLKFYSDFSRVKIIFNNLTSNAIKYMRPDTTEHYLKIHVSKAQGGINMVVKDNGIGIKPEHLERSFEMFFRATNQATGSGLGLYIVKETVNKLKGEISISSELGKGTRFNIYLPNLQ